MEFKNSSQVLDEISSTRNVVNNRGKLKMIAAVATAMAKDPNDLDAIEDALGDCDLGDFVETSGYINGWICAKFIADGRTNKLVNATRRGVPETASKSRKRDTQSFSVSRYRK